MAVIIRTNSVVRRYTSKCARNDYLMCKTLSMYTFASIQNNKKALENVLYNFIQMCGCSLELCTGLFVTR